MSSQARASAAVIGIAPFVFSIVVALTDPGSIALLLGSPIGFACLTSGLAADGLGAWWMRRIVARAGGDRDTIAAQQADVIDLFVLAVGAGLNLRLALTAVARRAPPAWAPSLGALVDQIERGQRVSDTLNALPDALGEPARPLVGCSPVPSAMAPRCCPGSTVWRSMLVSIAGDAPRRPLGASR